MSDPSIPFRTIHDTYRPKILRYLMQLVGPAGAEDLTQDVLVKVSRGLGQFRGDSSLSTWIYRIATNSALDRLRLAQARPAGGSASAAAGEEGDDDPGSDSGREEAAAPSAEEGAVRLEMSRCVLEFVDRLPDNYRTVVVLSELEGFGNAEIADILGVSAGTVKIRLHRAREKLRQALSTGCSFHRDERSEFACDRKA